MQHVVKGRLLIVLLTIAYTLQAQPDRPDDAPIQKNYRTAIPLGGIKVEYIHTAKTSFYYHGMYNFNKEYRYLVTPPVRLYNTLGVETALTPKWYLGLSGAYHLGYISSLNLATIRINMMHRGKIGSLLFLKEANLEYIHHVNDLFFQKKRDYRVGLAIGLGKKITVAKRPLFIMMSYKALNNSAILLSGDYGIYNGRFIDFTRARVEVTYGISKNIYAGVYAERETEYYYPPGTSAGNPPVNIYYKQNMVNPLLGVSLHIVLHPERNENYIPGLPFR